LPFYTKDASSEVKVFDADGKNESSCRCRSIGSAYSFSGRWETPEFSIRLLRTTRRRRFTGTTWPKNEQNVGRRTEGRFDGSQFAIEQVWYESKDKTRVPMISVSQERMKQDPSTPVLLTGYGGFDSSETPFYSAFYLYWAESGGMLAVPSLRGGGRQYGEKWHRAGMLEKKQNVFDDFEYAAQMADWQQVHQRFSLSIYGVEQRRLAGRCAALTQKPNYFQPSCAAIRWKTCSLHKFMEWAVLGSRIRTRKIRNNSNI